MFSPKHDCSMNFLIVRPLFCLQVPLASESFPLLSAFLISSETKSLYFCNSHQKYLTVWSARALMDQLLQVISYLHWHSDISATLRNVKAAEISHILVLPFHRVIHLNPELPRANQLRKNFSHSTEKFRKYLVHLISHQAKRVWNILFQPFFTFSYY